MSDVDLSLWFLPARNQGDKGSCDGFAWVYAREYFRHRMTGETARLSPQFLAYMERLENGTETQDSGATIYEGVVALAAFGVCQETQDTYTDATFFTRPTDAMIQEAQGYRIQSYRRVTSLEDLKLTLSLGYPVVIGISVFPSFETAQNGMIPMPDPSKESGLGGHAICCVGYGSQGIKFINSWGQEWGQNGYGWLPESYFDLYVHDMWTCTADGYVPNVDPSTLDLNAALNALQGLGCTSNPSDWVKACEAIKAHPEQFTGDLGTLRYLELLIKKFYFGLLTK